MSRKHPKRIPRPGVDEYGRTPLHYASSEGNLERVRELIAHGSSPTAQDDDGWSPLHFAIQGGHAAIIDYLLESGADPNATDSQGNGPLWVATLNARGDYRFVTRLLKAGADARRKNKHGRSPYDMAMTIRHGLDEVFANVQDVPQRRALQRTGTRPGVRRSVPVV